MTLAQDKRKLLKAIRQGREEGWVDDWHVKASAILLSLNGLDNALQFLAQIRANKQARDQASVTQ